MRKQLNISFALLLSLFSLSGCSSNDEKRVVIRVLNAADYIYEAKQEGYYYLDEDEAKVYISENKVTGDEENGYYYNDGEEIHEVNYDSDMMQQFVEYMDEKYADKGIKFDYVYDTFDTPETCYNELKTGKSKYDVINVSDYMIQKMITNKLIQPLFNENNQEQKETIRSYMSPYLWGEEDSVFNKINPKKVNGEKDNEKILADYAVPYMWGTIGIMYNYGYYQDRSEEEISKEYIDEQFSTWEVLYGDFAKKSFTIKDSVRDVYAVSILHSSKKEIADLEERFLPNDLDGFNKKLTELFNSCDEETIKKVKDDMLSLKANAFGFEVDSGKTDMVSGEKIGANLAWSGDATWAINEAQNENDVEIGFQIPKEGSNIWFDAWCVPTVAAHPEYALDLIEFMSEPTHAVDNMDYVGYTSSTAGDDVLDYIRDLYNVDEEKYPNEPYDLYDLSYFFEGSLDEERDPEDMILHAWRKDTETTYENDPDGEPMAVYARMLPSQFPEKSQLPRLCVMDDYGKSNEVVLDMWQSVRTNPLPLWAIILFAVEGVIAVVAIAYFVYNKSIKAKLRKRRKMDD